MSGRVPHLEIVRTDAGFLVRWRAGNGREVARSSEVYRRRIDAYRCAGLVAATGDDPDTVRELDERSTP